MIRFYAPDIVSEGILPPSDSAHCSRVLRLQPGDMIECVDGRGGLYRCRITVSDPRKTRAEVISEEKLQRFWPSELTIAVAPTKNADRMEWALEKMTEFGIDRFVPVRCEHSERKDINRDRLEKIAVSAMKQSLKALLPDISPTVRLKDFLKACGAEQKFICWCSDEFIRRDLLDELKPGKSTAVLIGPEGDFSPDEVKMAIGAGFVPVTLGPARLRTETAALDACHSFHILNRMANLES